MFIEGGKMRGKWVSVMVLCNDGANAPPHEGGEVITTPRDILIPGFNL